jgi:hypothetical protein
LPDRFDSSNSLVLDSSPVPEARRIDVGSDAPPVVLDVLENRTMSRIERWIVYSALAFLSLVVFGRELGIGMRPAGAEPVPKRTVVEAQEFRLLDEKGKERASLSAPSGDRASWGLYFFDKAGANRAFLAFDGDDRPMMGIGPFGFQATESGANTIEIVDKKGTTRMVLGVSATGSCGVMFVNEDGKPGAGVLVDSKSSSITLSDKDGKVLWRAPPQ